MGICLDTDANTLQEEDESDAGWKGGESGNSGPTPTASSRSRKLIENIKFNPPEVPVIFVLGGPGSGKVTHCDTLMQERKGLVHINMMDLLQQFALGNVMQDYSQLPSKIVIEVLMLEMKMAPTAKEFLISGFPRSMRDVVQYFDKIQVLNGVILISWRQLTLQKQIEYGSRLGHVVLSLAKMELENFFKSVMPVADYFDQNDMLIAVNGERAPDEVYRDFRSAVLNILDGLENQEATLNGISGMGKGINDIPGSIVSVDTAPSQQKTFTESEESKKITISDVHSMQNTSSEVNIEEITHVPEVSDKLENIPPIIWVIGGPGSNKAVLCLQAINSYKDWGHFSIGRILRAQAEMAASIVSENYKIKETLSSGETVPENYIDSIMENNLRQLKDKKGILIDSYPRSMEQVKSFELKYKQKPPIILLDCSKLQLGRGRIDDTVSSFRRRLEIFREKTLPMLKELDAENRLTIIDGDTESSITQKEFQIALESIINQLSNQNILSKSQKNIIKTEEYNTDADDDTILQDLEEQSTEILPTVSHHISLVNGKFKGSTKEETNLSSNIKDKRKKLENKRIQNGFIPNGGINLRNVLEADRGPVKTFL